jgi:hypothetical protein
MHRRLSLETKRAAVVLRQTAGAPRSAASHVRSPLCACAVHLGESPHSRTAPPQNGRCWAFICTSASHGDSHGQAPLGRPRHWATIPRAASAPGRGSPLSHMCWSWAHPAHICPGTGGCRGCCCTGTLPPNHTVSDVGIFPRRIRRVCRHHSLPLLRVSLPLLRFSMPIGAVCCGHRLGISWPFPCPGGFGSLAADFDVTSYYSLVRRRSRARTRKHRPCPPGCMLIRRTPMRVLLDAMRMSTHASAGLSCLRSRRPRRSRRLLRGTRRLRRL